MVDGDGCEIEVKRAKRKKRLGDSHGSVDASLLVVLGWGIGGLLLPTSTSSCYQVSTCHPGTYPRVNIQHQTLGSCVEC